MIPKITANIPKLGESPYAEEDVVLVSHAHSFTYTHTHTHIHTQNTQMHISKVTAKLPELGESNYAEDVVLVQLVPIRLFHRHRCRLLGGGGG